MFFEECIEINQLPRPCIYSILRKFSGDQFGWKIEEKNTKSMPLGFPLLFKCSNLILTHVAWNNQVFWDTSSKSGARKCWKITSNKKNHNFLNNFDLPIVMFLKLTLDHYKTTNRVYQNSVLLQNLLREVKYIQNHISQRV